MMINVVSPSYKRADRLLGSGYFSMMRYVVRESQAESYIKSVGKDRVIVMPESADGNVTKARNWILRNLDRPLIMMDDDVKYIGYYEGRDRSNVSNRPKILHEHDLMEFFENSFTICDGIGSKMWGLSLNRDPISFDEWLPFSLGRIILGPFSGHLEHDIFYDESCDHKEDYDFALMMLNKYRKIFRWNKFFYECEHGDNVGGCVARRSFDYELQQCRRIEKKWGTDIIRYEENPTKVTHLLNAKNVNVPIKGV